MFGQTCFGFGSNGDISGGTVTTANNGLSLASSTTVVLGQDVGQSGNPAALTSSRQIPVGAFSISLTGTTTNNVFGIGITTPQSLIHLSRNGTAVAASAIPGGGISSLFLTGGTSGTIDLGMMNATNATAGHVSIQLVRCRGTLDVPLDVVANDQIGFINSYAYSSGAIRTRANIIFIVDDTPSGTSIPMAVTFAAGTTAATERMRIASTGNIGMRVTVPTAYLHIAAGTATANTAPLKLTSGTLLTAPEAGAIEFLTDNVYFTITTGTARKEFTLNDGTLTSGRVPFATTNGRLIDSASFTFDGTRLSPNYITVAAGTAIAGTAPLKLTSGTNLTTAEAGAFEYNGTNLFFTRTGTTRENIVCASAVTTEVLVSDTSVTINIDGTTYKLLARA